MRSFKATFANVTSTFLVNTGVCIPPKPHLKSSADNAKLRGCLKCWVGHLQKGMSWLCWHWGRNIPSPWASWTKALQQFCWCLVLVLTMHPSFPAPLQCLKNMTQILHLGTPQTVNCLKINKKKLPKPAAYFTFSSFFESIQMLGTSHNRCIRKLARLFQEHTLKWRKTWRSGDLMPFRSYCWKLCLQVIKGEMVNPRQTKEDNISVLVQFCTTLVQTGVY